MNKPAFLVDGADRPGTYVVTCDHATNRVPSEINEGALGISERDMARHIAFDIGARGVTLALAEALNAPAICSNFSRLVIDPNRGEDDPTLVMRLYDGTIIPANRNVDASDVEQRLELFYRPYHGAIAEALAARTNPILVAIHSFAPHLIGRPPRPWHVSVLHTRDARLADPLIGALEANGDWIVGRNEPYTGELIGDSVDRHATPQGHANALIEIRNDLIQTPDQQRDWALRLAECLDAARKAADL